MIPAAPSALAWALLILLGMIWGGSFLAVEAALDSFGALSIAAVRISLAAMLLAGLAFFRGDGLPDTRSRQGRRVWLHCFGMGLFSNALPFSLLSWGQTHVTSGYAGITMAAVPLLVLPLAHFLVPGERMSPRKAIGFATGFAGVALLIGPGDILAGGSGGIVAVARLACLAASACYAIGAIITRLAPPGPYLSFAAGGLLVATALITPLALLVEGWPADPSGTPLAGVIYLGVFPTAIATIILVYVVQSAGPSFLSLVNYQVPVWAVLLGIVVLGETLPAQFLAALALILAGLALSQARFGRSRKQDPP